MPAAKPAKDSGKTLDVSPPAKPSTEASDQPMALKQRAIMQEPVAEDAAVDSTLLPEDKQAAPGGTTRVHKRLEPVTLGNEAAGDVNEPSSAEDDWTDAPEEGDAAPSSSVEEETQDGAEAQPDAATDAEPAADDDNNEPQESSTADSKLAKSQKQAAEEQEAARQQLVTKLIEQRKYFVRTGEPAAVKSFRAVVVVLALLLILAGAYLAVDAGAVDAGIDLPVDVIKN